MSFAGKEVLGTATLWDYDGDGKFDIQRTFSERLTLSRRLGPHERTIFRLVD